MESIPTPNWKPQVQVQAQAKAQTTSPIDGKIQKLIQPSQIRAETNLQTNLIHYTPQIQVAINAQTYLIDQRSQV